MVSRVHPLARRNSGTTGFSCSIGLASSRNPAIELARSSWLARELLARLLVLDSSQVTTRESCREFDTRSHDAEAVGCRRLWRGAGVVHWQLRERAHVPRG